MAVIAAALHEKVSVLPACFAGLQVLTVILGGVLYSLHAAWGSACVHIVLHFVLCIAPSLFCNIGQPGRTDDTALLFVRCVLGWPTSKSFRA